VRERFKKAQSLQCSSPANTGGQFAVGEEYQKRWVKSIYMNYDELNLRVNAASTRLELEVEGHIAFIESKLSHEILFLIHTEVPPELEGKGVGSAIVKKALQYAKDNHYKIVPLCVFVQSYLKRHKEWDDIVSPNSDRFIDKD
jgi:predicted GNAT family acetyltransferase